MFALRRVAARSLAAPSLSAPLLTVKTASSRSYIVAASRCRRPDSSAINVSLFQRRWASDTPAHAEGTSTADEAAIESAIADAGDATRVSSQPDAEPSEPLKTPEEAAAAESAGETVDVRVGEEAGIGSEGRRGPEAEALGEDTSKWTIKREREHEQQQPVNVIDKTGIFVGNMFFDVTERMLKERFEEYGEVDTVKIAIDRRGLSRGFGWVHFRDAESAQRAMSSAHNQMWEGRLLAVMPAEMKARPDRRPSRGPYDSETLARRPSNPPSPTLFIGNLSYEMTDVDLNSLFQPIRNVVDVRVAIDRRTGQPRGFAHADFVNTEAAQEAAEILREKKVYGRQLRVDFSTSYGPQRHTER